MYLQWNDAIASQFFKPEMAGRHVYLYVTEELLDAIGSQWSLDHQDFVAATKAGPDWSTRGNVCHKALEALDRWRRRYGERPFPPYIGYLGLFVLAAGLQGSFAPHAYYPRLRTLLGEGAETGTYPGFHDTPELWADLEDWSNHHKNGELGMFTYRVAGQRAYVGLPIAQTILSERERHMLPGIFARSLLNPNAQPSDRELARLLKRHGDLVLRARTRRLLENPQDDLHIYNAFLETIRAELASWDGTASETTAAASPGAKPGPVLHYLSLRLCMDLDRVSRRATMSLRCDTGEDFPEEGLLLTDLSRPGTLLSCEEAVPGWSTKLADATSGRAVDASAYDWRNTISLEAKEPDRVFRLPGGPIRILVSGQREGLPGYVEANRIQRSVPFLLAVQNQHSAPIRRWGASGCEGFTELGIQTGLPVGWSLFEIKEALDDSMIRDRYPFLALSESIVLEFVGGTRAASGSGNRYLSFSRPEVYLDGGNGTEQLYCQDRELRPHSGTRYYGLPDDVPVDERLLIEVRRSGEVLRKKTLHLEGGFEWWLPQPIKTFGPDGRPERDISHGVAGACCRPGSGTNFGYLLPDRAFLAAEVYLVGQEPGQVALLETSGVPNDWPPVWVVLMSRNQKRGEVEFCGTDFLLPKRLPGDEPGKRAIKLWKEVIWHWRKRVEAPRNLRLRQLWREYVEAAADVRPF